MTRREKVRGGSGKMGTDDAGRSHVGHTPKLGLHPKSPGSSTSLTPQIPQDFTFLGYIQFKESFLSRSPLLCYTQHCTRCYGAREVKPKQGKGWGLPSRSLWSKRDGSVYGRMVEPSGGQVGSIMGGQKRRALI